MVTKRSRGMALRITKVAPLLAAVILAGAALGLTGCSGSESSSSPQTTTPVLATASTAPQTTATTLPPTVPEMLSLEAESDPSLAAADIADPYVEMNQWLRGIFKPDRELYNLLYHAVDTMQPSVDVSAFALDKHQMLRMFNALYGEAEFRFYYLKDLKLSKDRKTALLTYNGDTPEEVKRNKETLAARLSHLIYNVAPENYTDYQKALAVYEYICENAEYTGNMDDQTTWSPYGILMKGQGICFGYATLVDYVLNRIGVPTEYVQNDFHAWNIVTVGGKRYHMDLTWGAGVYGEMNNSLSFAFMDDRWRRETLQAHHADSGPFILGHFRDDPTHPAPCTDTSMAIYKDIGSCYALDIDNGKVYFVDEDGIKRMNLDATQVETVSGESAIIMKLYDGVIYFTSGDDNSLFKLGLEEGAAPERLAGTPKFQGFLDIVDGELRFSKWYDGADYQAIRLETFDLHAWDGPSTVALPALSVPRSRSFATTISFSEPMDTAADWSHLVYLADEQGISVPLHLLWSEDGRTLTLRPQECVADMSSVTVYVTDGAPAAAGGLSATRYMAPIYIEAGE